MKAVVLLSGGLDSTTVLSQAASEQYEIFALTVQYGQRHKSELQAARKVAEAFHVHEHLVFPIPLEKIGGSALTDKSIPVPEASQADEIPITYVPARNTIFLSWHLRGRKQSRHMIFLSVRMMWIIPVIRIVDRSFLTDSMSWRSMPPGPVLRGTALRFIRL